jgi:hypothetical protein
VVVLTIDNHVDIIAELVGLAIACNLEPACVWDGGQNRQAFDYLVDIGLILGGEQDDMTNHG